MSTEETIRAWQTQGDRWLPEWGFLCMTNCCICWCDHAKHTVRGSSQENRRKQYPKTRKKPDCYLFPK